MSDISSREQDYPHFRFSKSGKTHFLVDTMSLLLYNYIKNQYNNYLRAEILCQRCKSLSSRKTFILKVHHVVCQNRKNIKEDLR